MTQDPHTRRLSAIMATDVVGYSRLMAADETRTLEAMNTHHKAVFDPAVARHRGRIVKLMGDGALVEFSSVIDAINCAVSLQNAFAQENSHRADRSPMQLRIGINIGSRAETSVLPSCMSFGCTNLMSSTRCRCLRSTAQTKPSKSLRVTSLNDDADIGVSLLARPLGGE